MISFFLKGGIMMYPLLISSILVVAIIIDRFICFHHAEVDEKDLFIKIKDKLRSQGVDESIAYCDMAGGSIAAILKSGLQQLGKQRNKIEEAFEREALIEIPKLKRFFTGLEYYRKHSNINGVYRHCYGNDKCI